jgi:hypothetical protein
LRDEFEEMRLLMASSGNFKEYRNLLRAIPTPCVPYIGKPVYRTG